MKEEEEFYERGTFFFYDSPTPFKTFYDSLFNAGDLPSVQEKVLLLQEQKVKTKKYIFQM